VQQRSKWVRSCPSSEPVHRRLDEHLSTLGNKLVVPSSTTKILLAQVVPTRNRAPPFFVVRACACTTLHSEEDPSDGILSSKPCAARQSSESVMPRPGRSDESSKIPGSATISCHTSMCRVELIGTNVIQKSRTSTLRVANDAARRERLDKTGWHWPVTK
jgi:hypothetical protein